MKNEEDCEHDTRELEAQDRAAAPKNAVNKWRQGWGRQGGVDSMKVERGAT